MAPAGQSAPPASPPAVVLALAEVPLVLALVELAPLVAALLACELPAELVEPALIVPPFEELELAGPPVPALEADELSAAPELPEPLAGAAGVDPEHPAYKEKMRPMKMTKAVRTIGSELLERSL
jgi:hypothetical protein